MSATTAYANETITDGINDAESDFKFQDCVVQGDLIGRNVTLINTTVEGSVTAAVCDAYCSTIQGDATFDALNHHNSRFEGSTTMNGEAKNVEPPEELRDILKPIQGSRSYSTGNVRVTFNQPSNGSYFRRMAGKVVMRFTF